MRTIGTKGKPLSATKEDYVRAIFLIQEKSASTASVTAIASRLGLSKSTVSERINDLVADGLADAPPYTGVSLTKKGREEAIKLTYKHRLIEVFLNQVLKMPISKVHAEAHKLEHACSDEVIKRLADFLNNPTTDPHGTEILKPKKL